MFINYKRLYVLITVRLEGGMGSLSFEYDVLENGLCKNARAPENLSGSALTDAIRFTNHCIVASNNKLDGTFTLEKDVFKSMNADHHTIGRFNVLIKEATKRGEPLEFAEVRWNVK